MRFTAAQQFPPIVPGSRIVSIELIFDEGTDSLSVPDDPNGVGLAVVDNLDIDGTLIGSGEGVADGTNRDGDKDHGDHHGDGDRDPERNNRDRNR